MPAQPAQVVPFKDFTEAEHDTWRKLFKALEPCRQHMAVPEFAEGLKVLNITGDRIPVLDQVNDKLMSLTGWKAVPVVGLEEAASFYPMLAQRQYPIGNFIRDPRDLSYTPAPDIFHDLYGHMAFFIDPQYAQFCEEFGKRASRYVDSPEVMEGWERLFWLTAEFGLIETPQGRRIFGGGILSSAGESEYSLSDKPNVQPFDLEKIRQTGFRIDVYQENLFLLPSREALFNCLDDFEKPYL